MLGKLYLRLNYTNPLFIYPQRTFARVPRAVGPNDADIIRKLKNKKIEKFNRAKRFWDIHSTAQRPMPAGIYKDGTFETNFNNYSQKEMQSARLEACKHKFGNSLYDTGSAAMQAASLCEKTISMVKHLQKHHKDSNSARRMLRLLSKRRKALVYLKRMDFAKYSQIVYHYGLKDVTVGTHKTHFH